MIQSISLLLYHSDTDKHFLLRRKGQLLGTDAGVLLMDNAFNNPTTFSVLQVADCKNQLSSCTHWFWH